MGGQGHFVPLPALEQLPREPLERVSHDHAEQELSGVALQTWQFLGNSAARVPKV